jgi:hypothetical protein
MGATGISTQIAEFKSLKLAKKPVSSSINHQDFSRLVEETREREKEGTRRKQNWRTLVGGGGGGS